ncbi:glycosyltransferase family 2 protein [Chloroflexota bacterium]
MKQSSKSSHPGNPKVLAGLPAFNEEKYIGTIILKTKKHVDEVIIVDDGSEDQTAEIAGLAGATVIKHNKNKGYGASIQALLAEARKRRPDIFVLLDADAQHNPDEIPELIKPLAEGYDIVIGSREERKEDIPRYRRLGQRVISFFSHILSGTDVVDSESGFRAFSGKAIEALSLHENGMAISAETIAEATEKGLKITETPISIRYTEDGSTLNPVVHGFEVLRRILVMISEKKPLYFFGLGGIFFMVIGLIAGIQALRIVFTGGGAVNGWTLVSLLLLLVGVFSFFTGIILNAFTKRRI